MYCVIKLSYALGESVVGSVIASSVSVMQTAAGQQEVLTQQATHARLQ